MIVNNYNEATPAALGYIPFDEFNDGFARCLGSQNVPKEVFLVEDEEDTLALLSHKLENVGFEVTPFNKGLTAFHIFNQMKKAHLQPDCFIIDLIMPEINGFELARALRLKGFDGLIIGVTATNPALIDKGILNEEAFTTIVHKRDIQDTLPRFLSLV